LECIHPALHQQLVAAVEASKSAKSSQGQQSRVAQGGTSQQTTLLYCAERSKKYSRDSEKWKSFTNAIAMMIYDDLQLFSFVQDRGFVTLLKRMDPRYEIPSRQYMSETLIPELYNPKKADLKAQLLSVCSLDRGACLAFSTDGWTSRAVDSYISYIVHYIDKDWIRHKMCLDTYPFPVSHTAENILKNINDVLVDWGLTKAHVSSFVRDNAANIVKALRDGQYTNVGFLITPCSFVLTQH